MIATMPTTMLTGRPLQFDEPLNNRKPIYFTASQIDLILAACGGDRDFGAFVREAAIAKASGNVEEISRIDPAIIGEMRAEIRAAVRDVLGEMLASDDLREDLARAERLRGEQNEKAA